MLNRFSPFRSSRVCRAAMVSALAIGLGVWSSAGCSLYRPGGSGWSDDAFTYFSKPYTPATVTLVDTRTGENLWSYEVPVGRQLTLRFYKIQKTKDEAMPDLMRWDDYPQGKEQAILRNTMQVPPASGRRLELTYRKTPEYGPRALLEPELSAPPPLPVAEPAEPLSAEPPAAVAPAPAAEPVPAAVPAPAPAAPEPSASDPSQPPSFKEVPPSNPG